MIAYDKKSSHLSLSNQELGGFGVFFASLWFHAKIQPGDIGKAWRKEGARIDSGAISTLMYNVASQKCPKRNSSKTANNQQATQAGSLLFQQNQPLAFAKCSDVTNWDSDTFEFADSTSTMCHFQPSEDWVADGRCPSKLVTLKFILNIVYIYMCQFWIGSHIQLRTQTPNMPCESHHLPSLWCATCWRSVAMVREDDETLHFYIELTGLLVLIAKYDDLTRSGSNGCISHVQFHI